MAIGRYDPRKNYEEAETNAIGTEYVWAGLLRADNAAKVRHPSQGHHTCGPTKSNKSR